MRLFIVTVLLLTSIYSYGQQHIISGRILDQTSRQPVEFATIAVVNSETDKPITGGISDMSGNFSVKTDANDFYIQISFIGYKTLDIEDFDSSIKKINLGDIQIEPDMKQLDEVVITGEKSQTEFHLDKRVFNVGQDLSSTGASALEVLNNVPSVNVNIEGQISLRGSTGVQVLINGKPSVLTSDDGGNALGTITADMIDKIEVITNPSAKYEAEGTSGIINIVIKKEERRGTNGSVSLNTGTPHNHSLGFSMNHRTEHFNIFTQIGAGYRELPSDNKNTNTDKTSLETVSTIGEEYRNENFYNFILGTDYHINSHNVLTVSGNFALELEDQPSATDFTRTDANGNILSQWSREEDTEATNPKWQYEAQYKRDFRDHEDHDLLISAVGSYFGKDQSSEFYELTSFGTYESVNQQTRTNFKEGKNTLKIDYTKPFENGYTIETGTQYVFQDVSNDYEVKNLIDGEFVNDPNLTNIFDYDQKVLGVYGTGAYEGDKWGLKTGLRVEHTDLQTLLVNTDQDNRQLYTNLFPTVHTSYKINKKYSLQAGYSRRIFRPRLWDLNPFFNIRNSFSIRTGNPELLPEFTDSYELTSMVMEEDFSLNFGVYYRYTTDVVERVSIFENNVNTTKPLNIGTNRSTGLELNGKYNPVKWFAVNADFNYNFFNREGTLESKSFDFTGDQWSSKVNTKWKLPASIDMEITGHYRSAFKTVQSTVSSNLFMDFGIRKKIVKGKAVVNLSVRDVFASRFRENEIDQDAFYVYSRSQRGRFVTLGFSFGFGKGEAMEFSGQKRH